MNLHISTEEETIVRHVYSMIIKQFEEGIDHHNNIHVALEALACFTMLRMNIGVLCSNSIIHLNVKHTKQIIVFAYGVCLPSDG